ncbi:hypothetical protein N9247_00170 [bacterium]|nr:hypothetical protein [bacterium]
MSIDYLRDIKPLEDQGISDEVIAQHLRDATANAIPCSSAKEILQENGAVIIDPITGDKSGLLISYYQTLAIGSESQVLIAYFIEHVFEGGAEVDTNAYPRSIQWASVTSAMPAELQPTVSALSEAAGGRPNPDVSVADIVASREAYEAEQAAAEAEREARANFAVKKARYDELYNEYIAPLQIQPGVTDADWSAALNSMADNFPLSEAQ